MAQVQVYIDLAYQRRLRQSDVMLRAEVFAFKTMLENQGYEAAAADRYSVSSNIRFDAFGQEISRDVELKLLGTWTSIVVETRAPGVLVIHG